MLCVNLTLSIIQSLKGSWVDFACVKSLDLYEELGLKENPELLEEKRDQRVSSLFSAARCLQKEQEVGKGGLGWTWFCSVLVPFFVSVHPPGDVSLSISIYKSSQGCKKVRLQHFFTPDKSTVMSLACTSQSLYAGLVNGTVAVYTRADGECPGVCLRAEVSLLRLGGGSLWAQRQSHQYLPPRILRLS